VDLLKSNGIYASASIQKGSRRARIWVWDRDSLRRLLAGVRPHLRLEYSAALASLGLALLDGRLDSDSARSMLTELQGAFRSALRRSKEELSSRAGLPPLEVEPPPWPWSPPGYEAVQETARRVLSALEGRLESA